MTTFLTRGIEEAEQVAAEPWRAPSADGSSAWAEAGRRPREEELEAIREAARQEGYEAGRVEGRAAMEAHAQRLEELVNAAVRPLAELDEAVLADLTTLVLRATSEVLRHEARTDPAVVREALELALEHLPAMDRDIEVRVHPEDVAVVEETLSGTAVAQRARVTAMPELRRGGVELLAGPSRIDATVETRISEVFARILDDRAAAVEADDARDAASA